MTDRPVARGLLTALAGAASVLALPPFGLWPFAIAYGAILFPLRRSLGWRRSALELWPFFAGRHLAGLYWVGFAFFADAERFAVFALPAVLSMCAALAAVDAAIVACLALRRWRSLEALAIAAAAAVLLGEWARSEVFRFPWNPVALSWDASLWMLQSLAWIGPWALGFVTLLAACALAGLTPGCDRPRPRALAAFACAALAVLWALGGLRLARPPSFADAPEFAISIVQANIAQHHKWDPELRGAWFARHLELARGPGAASLVIWPESAVPYLLETDAAAREAIAAATPEGGVALVGSDRWDGETLTNSMIAIDANGAIVGRYDKVDLVPFGEFLPFRPILGALGLEALAVGSTDFTPGPGRRALELDGHSPILPLICYEAVYARAPDGPALEADLLVNVTNDAWFGDTTGPRQHLGMARMRAVETGRPLARAANTGISALFDPMGRELARLELGVAGRLDAVAPPPLAHATLYAKFSRELHMILVFSALAFVYGYERKGARSATNASSV